VSGAAGHDPAEQTQLYVEGQQVLQALQLQYSNTLGSRHCEQGSSSRDISSKGEGDVHEAGVGAGPSLAR